MSSHLSLGQGWQSPGQRANGQQDGGGSSQMEDGFQGQLFGDPLFPKPSHMFRIFLLNIGGLGKTKNNPKSHALQQLLLKHQVDVCCLTETNVHWTHLPPEDRAHSRFQHWFENLQVNTSYFKDYPYATWHQVGGTCLLSINEGCTRVMSSGRDPDLGRWTWTRYRGKQGLSLRVFSAYRPTPNTGGTQTAYSQQKWYYQTKKDQDLCPRQSMIDDLCIQIQEALNQGDQVVVAIDANEDIRRGYAQQQFSRCGLTELILSKHGSPETGTYARGSSPIDGLWVSSTLLGSRCGYLPHGEGPPGCDHCVLWLEFSKPQILGNTMASVRPAARRLKCNDPRIVDRFQTHYLQKLMQANLLVQCQELHDQMEQGQWTDNMAADWERLDDLRMTFLAEADRKCRKLRMGGVDWSPEIAAARQNILAWSLLLQRLRNQRYNRPSRLAMNGRYIRRVLTKTGIPLETLQWSIQDVQQKYQQVVRAYYKLKPFASQKRYAHLESLALAKAEFAESSSQLSAYQPSNSQNTTLYSKILKQLKLQEQQRRNARIVKFCNGKLGGSSGLPMVIAPGTHAGERVPCYTKEEIEQAIFAENKRRFWQASHTPFLQPPLIDKVGPMGTGPGAEEILSTGKLSLGPEDPPLDEGTLLYLEQLKRDDNMTELSLDDVQITEELHRQAWRVAKEQTSSGDPLLHFGHCKACATHPNLSQFEAQMRNIPFCTGFSPERWQRVVNVELLKKPGNFNVERLRTIMLMEAAWNNNNKILGRQLMWYAEREDLLAPEQYGSRKHRSASTQALNKKLVFDLHRQQRLAGAIGSNDAKSCYDRIVHSVAMLSMRRMGYPLEPLICMFSTLQQLRQYIRTSAGDSETFYDGSHTNIPMQGTGQGNGASPAIWAVVSTPILKLLRIEDLGVFFQSALDNEEVKLVGFAFVDDTDLATSARDPLHPSAEAEVTARMQKSFDTWISGLHATGGAVNAEKSHWTMISFEWDSDGQFSYKSVADTPADIWVTDFDGQRKKLRRLEATTGDRMLGVRLSADGLDKEEVEYRKEQATQWCDRIRSGHLPRHLAWQSLTTTIMPQLEYPLPATTFTRQQCRDIMSPVLQAGLPASGIVRTFPHPIVYGPLKYQGLGVNDLYVTQGIAHIENLINHAYSAKDPTGKLLRASAQHLVLELGTGDKLFSHDYRTLADCATRSWMKHTWKFFSEFQIELESTTPALQPQCPDDKFLIPAFQQHYPKGLPRLNRCRMYLNVCSLAEITTADGQYITLDAWNGQRASVATNKYTWPNQGRPSNDSWRLFREALTTAFGVHPITRKLAQPLNHWNLLLPSQFYYCEPEQRVYSKHQQLWRVHLPSSLRATHSARREFNLQHASTAPRLPPEAARISVHLTPAKIRITGIAPQFHQESFTSPSPPPPNQSFTAFLKSQPESATWAWQDLHFEGNPLDLLQAIQEGKGTAVSDGSYKVSQQGTPFGTSSWIYYVSDFLWIRGSNSIPGSPRDQSSYRSELGGLFGLVYCLTALVEYFQGAEASSFAGSIPIGCDGETALFNCFSPGRGFTTSNSDYDLIIAIRRRLSHFPSIEWQPQHITGHQDDLVDFEDLDLRSQLNVQCDEWAKEWWHTCARRSNHNLCPSQNPVQNAPWAIKIGDQLVSKNLKTALRELCSGGILKAYWEKKKRFTLQPADAIDWDSSHRALQGMNQGQRREFIKHHSGHLDTNKNMKRRKHRETSACPRCDAPVEDSLHLITCPHEAATDLWEKSIQHISAWLQSSHTDPDLAHIIVSRLQSWRHHTEDEEFSELSHTHQQLIHSQDNIGWESAFRGCWAIGWAEAQAQHFKTLRRRNSGKRWLAALITKLWQVAWDMWEHRNGILTAKDQGQIAQLLRRDIELEYSRGFQQLPSDLRRISRLTIEQVFQKPLLQQKEWLGRIRDGRSFGEAEDQRSRARVRAQQRFMANWRAGIQQS